MNVARFGTAWLMIFIAVLAFNFAVVRYALDNPDLVGQLLAFGFMPMASILAIGLLVGFLRRCSRPYLLGFESFGAIASVVFLLLVIFYRNEIVRPYACRFIDPLEKIMGTDESLSFVLTACPVLVFVLTLPQVTFALVGGVLTRRFKITANPR